MIIGVPITLHFHAAQPAPDHRVQFKELRLNTRQTIGIKIIGNSAQHRIDLLNHLVVKVVGADGQRLDLLLKLLHRFRAHSQVMLLEVEPQKVEAVGKSDDLRLFGREPETKLPFNHAAHNLECLFNFRFGLREHKEVVGIPDKGIPMFGQFPVQHVEHDVSQKRGDDATNTIDNFEFDRIVPYAKNKQKYEKRK